MRQFRTMLWMAMVAQVLLPSAPRGPRARTSCGDGSRRARLRSLCLNIDWEASDEDS